MSLFQKRRLFRNYLEYAWLSDRKSGVTAYHNFDDSVIQNKESDQLPGHEPPPEEGAFGWKGRIRFFGIGLNGFIFHDFRILI